MKATELAGSRTEQLNQFFDDYAGGFNSTLKGAEPDVDAVTGRFAECFVESSPLGVMCKKNDSEFKKVVPEGYNFYKSIGITAMDIVSKKVTLLDEFHAMVKVHWRSVFTRKDKSKGSVEFDVIYMLQTKDDNYKIFAYITGDEQKSLKENGLIE